VADRLLYMAHTSPAVRRQALYSALSALAHAGGAPPAVHVYTDAPEAFSRLGDRALVTELPRETFAGWALPAGYHHRAKPAAIRHLAERHPGDRILFADADTVFAGPARALFERIEPGAAVMHQREYNVAASDLAVMHRFRRRLRKATFRGAPVALDLDMWNSGAVGLHPALFPLVDDWLAYLDEVFPQVKRWVLEQYALVSVLAARGVAIREAGDVLVHYWFDKEAYSAAVDAALERTARASLDEALAYVRENPIARPRRAPAAAYGKPANFFQRTFGW
jgi:hypothetical protein